MSVTYTATARCCTRVLQQSSKRICLAARATTQLERRAPSRRWESTTAEAPIDPKISTIVDQISQLTLLETADLVSNLKIPDLPIGGFSAGAGGGAAAAPPPEEADEPAPVTAQEKTLFTLHLKSFEAGAKPKVIKEIKSMLGLSLVDSKKFVESAPKMMKEGIPKEEGEKIVELMKGLGAVVGME
ncbi:uncharacterized protein KY384_003064 [Bacidia gigantensis]|uniref:uncharacterized protein n=1 Tax=Bacidia gigantensis TaxID=2732470 RepID=UPI001D05090B|nr:uncharacterized protein KY384_003064 [Bacidia gigantensis]KAG8531435.1 hypothetical protein KY384_003064 [Bacidia gigantensis]